MRSLIRAFASRLNIKLLTEHHLGFLSSKRGCIVYSGQNATLMEITCHGSFVIVLFCIVFLQCKVTPIYLYQGNILKHDKLMNRDECVVVFKPLQPGNHQFSILFQ